MRWNSWILFLMAIAAVAVAACGDDDGGTDDPQERETDTGSDPSTSDGSDGDADTDAADDDGDPPEGGEVCLDSVSGKVLKNGTDPIDALVAFCLGEDLCFNPPTTTGADGSFHWRYPRSEEKPCVSLDLVNEWLHLQIFASDLDVREDFASYSIAARPTQEEISDQGEDDFNLDLGDLALYELPAPSVTYEPAAGAVVDAQGLRFELPPGGLVKRPQAQEGDAPVENPQPIRVFRAPLDEWTPPFVDSIPDALYYLSPRWAKIKGEGVSLSFDPPEGWKEGDVGTLHVLGSWTAEFPVDEGPMTSEYIYRNGDGLCVNTDETDGLEQVFDGFYTPCGTAEMIDGRVITSPIPRFAWVAISK